MRKLLPVSLIQVIREKWQRVQVRLRHIADVVWQTAWQPGFQSVETVRFVVGGSHARRARENFHSATRCGQGLTID